VDERFKILIRVTARAIYGRVGYVKMMLFLMIKNILLCKSSTGAVLCYVHGRLFSLWRTTTYL
jgi:hypothetical protein